MLLAGKAVRHTKASTYDGAYPGLEVILDIDQQRIQRVPVEQGLHAISTPPRRVVPQRLDVAKFELFTGLRSKKRYVGLCTYLDNRALEMRQRGRWRTFPTTTDYINKRIIRYPTVFREKAIHDMFLCVTAQHQSVLKEGRLEIRCLAKGMKHVQKASVPGMRTGYTADVDLVSKTILGCDP